MDATVTLSLRSRNYSVRMTGAAITVKDAATRLGVSEQRVRRLIGDGDILAERHGHVWAVDPAALDDYRRRRRPTAGRGLSPRIAWAALLSEFGTSIDDELIETFALRRSERDRLARLRNRDPIAWRWLAHRRANTERIATFDAYLEQIKQMDNVVRTGLSAVNDYSVDLAVHSATLDIYVDTKTAANLTTTMRLKPASVGNLTLRILTGLTPHDASSVLDRDVMPPAVVGVDLLDDADGRTERAGIELIKKVLDGA
jgi:excisionase family DNA binding protein